MSVVIETTLGDITVDLFLSERPTACMNFLKLCKMKYYNYNLFHTISRGFIAQSGDPTGSRTGGESIFGILNGPDKRYFQGENKPRIKHTKMGLISFVGNENFMLGSQFFLTLGEELTYLDEKHCVFGEVVEGFDILEVINEVICDGDDRPYQDVRITHTVILDDPFPDPERLRTPSRSPSPSVERLMGGRIAPDEDINEMEGKNAAEVAELQADREAKARATILEMVGDIPDAEMAPPENVLFVCKLNPVTTDEDLEIIFNRFGKIKSCEVIRDRKTGDSLQYAFIEFEDQKACEDAYFKMDNILIDDRRIHVDFSQSVSKIKWHGKGRGVTHFDESGKKIENGIGKNGEKANSSSRNINKSSSSNTKKSNRDRESYEYKYSQKNTESYKSNKSHYDKREDYSSDRSRNRSEYYKRSYEKNYSSLERDRSGHESNRKNEMDYKRKPEKYNTHRKRNERNHYEETTRRGRSSRDRDRKPDKRKYSSEHENSVDKQFNKKQVKYEKHKIIDEKLEKKSNRDSSSRKKKTRSVSCSSSESSHSEYDKKKRKAQKQIKKKEHISDESSDDTMCKKKKKKVTRNKHITSSSSCSTSSSSETEETEDERRFKNKTNKKKARRDKSSDSDSGRKKRKK